MVQMDFELNSVPKKTYKHNRRVDKNRKRFSKDTIQEIFERDGFKCVRCYSTDLEGIPHHITFRSQGGLGTKRNGCAICLKCHREAHRYDEVRRWFESWRDTLLNKDGDYIF